MKPLFNVAKGLGKGIEGDFITVERKEEHTEFDTGLHTSIIKVEKEIIRRLNFKDDSLMNKMFEKVNIRQGYILCDNGLLYDICITFFLIKHKPTPTFVKATIKGVTQVQSITGFSLPIYDTKI